MEPAGHPSQPGLPESPTKKKSKLKRPTLDWAALHAKTWGVDVWTCRCGGKRKVMAVVTSRRTAEELLGNLGLMPPPFAPLPLAQAPPQPQLQMLM